MNYLKLLAQGSALLILLAIGIMLTNESLIEEQISDRRYADPETVPYNRVGLVLGTLPNSGYGGPNQFFVERMEAAAALYCTGKVQHLILSGDEDRFGYNEPMDMRNALVAMGVDTADMTLDIAGFTTFDSVLRTKQVFGQHQFTIISQPSHNARALYIAHERGLDAIAFNAKDVPPVRAKRSWLRERGARLKMWKDLLTLQPLFRGETMSICSQVLPPC